MLLLFLLMTVANSYSLDWKYHTNPNGMMIKSILSYDENLIFAGTDPWLKTSNKKSGIIKSTDGGLTWNQIDNAFLKNTVCSFLLKDRNNNIWAIIDESKIYKSSDLGETWVLKGEGFKSLEKMIEANNGNFIVVGSTDFLLSKDGGETWEHLVEGFLYIFDIAKTSNGDIFILPNENGIWKSTDNGESFFDFTQETLYDKNARVIFVDNSDNLWVSTWNAIYFSSDNGITWESRMNGLESNYKPKGKCYAQDPISGDVVLGTYGSVLQKFDIENNKWVNYSNNFPCRTVYALSFDNKGNLYVGDYASGIFISQDGGLNWLYPNTNVGTKIVTQLFNYNDRLFIGNYDGSVYELKDEEVSSKPIRFATPIAGNVMSIYYTKNGSLFISIYSDDFYRSSDYGKTWEKLYNIYNFRPYTYTEKQDTIFAGAGLSSNVKGIFFSTDDGTTWNNENSNISNHDIRILKKNHDEQMIAGTSKGVFIKNAITHTWDETSFPKRAPFDIVTNSVGDIFVGYHNNDYTSIYKSDNNGLTVSEITLPIIIKKMIVIDNESSSMMDDVILAADSSWYIISDSKINTSYESFPAPQNGLTIWSLTYNKSRNSIFAGYFYGLYELNLNTTSVNLRNPILNTFAIFPNPATEYIEIAVDVNPTVNRRVDEGAEIKIFNTLGECVMTAPTALPSTGSGSGNFRIDVSHLPRGLYYVRIGNRTQMFVKM